MNKKQKDISTYFISNKKRKGDDAENNSQQLTTNNFNDTDCNSESDIRNNEVLADASSLLIDQNSNNTINVPIDDDNIGLYVTNNTAKNDFSLLNRLLVKPFTLSSSYVFPKVEQNGKKRSVCQHSWLAKYTWLTYS